MTVTSIEAPTTLADRLDLPAGTQAILWDMDGVLLDTLGLDFTVCNQLLAERFGGGVTVDRDFIRSIFAYHPPEFWARILDRVGAEHALDDPRAALDAILPVYEAARRTAVFELNEGIAEILAAARDAGLPMAVVSNNATEDVRQILTAAGIAEFFAEILGNDLEDLAKKPAPDTYLAAARRLGVAIERCVVVEDSVLGLEAGRRARAHVVAVATGGNGLEELLAAGSAEGPHTNRAFADRGVERFAARSLRLRRGHVTRKHLATPNEFVSHMLEHIAWRLGVEIELDWFDDGWLSLGETLGRGIAGLNLADRATAALGMIDDGSAEIHIGRPAADARCTMAATSNIDLDWFLGCRCEQIATGQPLVELLDGLARGLGRPITATVWSAEDPHHAWEGVFRSVGIALSRLLPPADVSEVDREPPAVAAPSASGGAIVVRQRGIDGAAVERKTAESDVEVQVAFDGEPGARCQFEVPTGLPVQGLGVLLDLLAKAAGIALDVRFTSLVLSSSHVVAEDVGLVLGRALQEILVLRMEQQGATGAGSSVAGPNDLTDSAVRVGVSVEGRKCWVLVPGDVPFEQLRREFVVGHTVEGDLYSEDLDDFLDGLSGGLACSIVVHFTGLPEPETGWRLLFKNLGHALAEVFTHNPYRRGVPPGVKATLQ